MSVAGRELGFTDEEWRQAERVLEAFAAPADLVFPAADLARFVQVPIDDAAMALAAANAGRYGDLRRLGFAYGSHLTPDEYVGRVRGEIAGMAAAFTTTMRGRALVDRLTG